MLLNYRSSRPVNHEEVDVYICESVYDESRRMTRPLPTTGLKHYEHVSSDVVPEEVFFFKRKIVVNKVLVVSAEALFILYYLGVAVCVNNFCC